MEPEFVAVGLDESFNFTCNPSVPCFNACCHNLYQVLSPYDIFRLKRHLGITSNQFLAQYTQQAVGPETGLPVVFLRPDPNDDMACPFVTAEGCKVYADRPASCRIYPLARAATRCRQTGRITEHYALLKEAHCRGFDHGHRQSAASWIADQSLAAYHTMNDMLLEIIALKKRLHPGPLDMVSQRSFHMALYDLDGFRNYLENSGKSDPVYTAFCIAGNTDIEDDIALLKFGFHWIAETFKRKWA